MSAEHRTGAAAAGWRTTLAQYWQALSSRERKLVLAGASLLGLALLWTLALAPALQTLRQAPQQRAQLEAQLARMTRWAAQAAALRAAPRLEREAAVRALEAATRSLPAGQAQLSVQGERVSVSLRAISPDALTQWLAQVRTNAHALPLQAQLTRSASGWDGTLMLALPGAPL